MQESSPIPGEPGGMILVYPRIRFWHSNNLRNLRIQNFDWRRSRTAKSVDESSGVNLVRAFVSDSHAW